MRLLFLCAVVLVGCDPPKPGDCWYGQFATPFPSRTDKALAKYHAEHPERFVTNKITDGLFVTNTDPKFTVFEQAIIAGMSNGTIQAMQHYNNEHGITNAPHALKYEPTNPIGSFTGQFIDYVWNHGKQKPEQGVRMGTETNTWLTNYVEEPVFLFSTNGSITSLIVHNVATKGAADLPGWFDSTNWSLMFANGFDEPVGVVHYRGSTQAFQQYGIDYTKEESPGDTWNTNKLHIGATLSTVLTTNVTERFSSATPGMYALSNPPQWISPKEPDTKWTRTTIRRQTFVDFTVQGTPFKGLLKEEVLSDNEVEYVLERTDKWRVK